MTDVNSHLKNISSTPDRLHTLNHFVEINEDTEGGNIRIYSPDWSYVEMDGYNPALFRIYSVDTEGTYLGHIDWTKDLTLSLNELSSRTPFAFGIDAFGNYGYKKVGADTVTPFNTGDVYKNRVVDALQYSNLGLTYNNTWDDIINGINRIFPQSLDVLSYLGTSSIYLNGTNTTWTSAAFNISTFNTLTVVSTYSNGGAEWYPAWGSRPEVYAYLVTSYGNINILTTGNINISGYTGDAYIAIYTQAKNITASSDGSDDPDTMVTWTVTSSVTISKLLLQV